MRSCPYLSHDYPTILLTIVFMDYRDNPQVEKKVIGVRQIILQKSNVFCTRS